MVDAPIFAPSSEDAAPSPATTRDARGRFVPGQSGNPAGKRPGTRHIKTLLKESLTDDEGRRAARVVIEAAVEGDKVSARWLVGRIDGAPKGRFIEFAVEDNGDMTAGLDAAFRGVMDGTVTLAEAWDLMRWVQAYRNMVSPRRWMDWSVLDAESATHPAAESGMAAPEPVPPTEAADAPVAAEPDAAAAPPSAPAPASAVRGGSPAKHLHSAGDGPIDAPPADAAGGAGQGPATSPPMPLNRAMRRRAAALARAA